MSFFCCLAYFLLAVWFCIYTHAQLRILKFQDFVYQKAEVFSQTINEWRKSKRSVVLLRRQGFYCISTIWKCHVWATRGKQRNKARNKIKFTFTQRKFYSKFVTVSRYRITEGESSIVHSFSKWITSPFHTVCFHCLTLFWL